MVWIVQCRLMYHEFMVEVEAIDEGKAILEAASYLQSINQYAIFHVYDIKQKDCLDIVLEDLILN